MFTTKGGKNQEYWKLHLRFRQWGRENFGEGAGQPRFFLKRINIQRKRASGVAACRAIKVKKNRLSRMRPGTGAEGCREFGEVDERGI